MKRIRLKDVAEKAGVSVYSVSSALSGRGEISTQKRKWIRQIAEEMGYRPNVAGRILNARENRDMGLLILGTSEIIRRNIGFADFNLHFMRLCVENGVRHQTEWFSPEENPDRLPGLLADGLVGGVLIAGEPYGAVREYLAQDNTLPHVMLESEGRYFVRFNREPAIAEAVRYLRELGHRRIAMLNGFENYQTYRIARTGFENAMTADGAKWDPCLYWAPNGEFSLVDRVNHGMEFLFKDKGNRPTAILGGGGLFSKSIVTWLYAHNLRVPEEVSVIAFESADWEAQNFLPPLTAIEYDYKAAAEAAFRMLGKIMKPNETFPEKREIGIDEIFTVRESCLPPSTENNRKNTEKKV